MSHDNTLSSSQKNNRILIVIVLVVVCAIVYFVFMKIEWITEEIDKGFSKAAKKNPFLAADLFLDTLNVSSHYTSKKQYLDKLYLPGDYSEMNRANTSLGSELTDTHLKSQENNNQGIASHDVVVMLDARASLNEERSNRLLHWVHSGGTLVYSIENRFLSGAKARDYLLDEFELHYQSKVKDSFVDSVIADSDSSQDDDCDSDTNSVQSNDESGSASTNDEVRNKGSDSSLNFDENCDGHFGEEPDQLSNKKDGKNDNEDFDVERVFSEAAKQSHDNVKSARQSFSEENISCNSYRVPDTHVYLEEGGAFANHNSEQEPYKLATRTTNYLELASESQIPHATAYFEERLLYAQYQLGSGNIIFGADWSIWDNYAIACADHAYYLANLAKGANKVWFIQNFDAPSLWRLMWSKAYLFAIAASLALFFYLWFLFVRFGPIREINTRQHRNFSEHLKASGYLAWRSKHSSLLVFDLYRDVLARMQRHAPGFIQLDTTEKVNELHRHTQIPIKDLDRLVVYVETHRSMDDVNSDKTRIQEVSNQLKPQEFIQFVSILKDIKARL